MFKHFAFDAVNILKYRTVSGSVISFFKEGKFGKCNKADVRLGYSFTQKLCFTKTAIDLQQRAYLLQKVYFLFSNSVLLKSTVFAQLNPFTVLFIFTEGDLPRLTYFSVRQTNFCYRHCIHWRNNGNNKKTPVEFDVQEDKLAALKFWNFLTF